jgi:hypothetical protein
MPPPHRERDPQEVYETEQRALLDLLLEEFRGVLTYREALTAQVDDPEDFGDADRFGHATQGLVASGLLVRQGELMIPAGRPLDGRPRLDPRLMDTSAQFVAAIVGPRTRRIRRAQELRQEALADYAEIHRTQISLHLEAMLETGRLEAIEDRKAAEREAPLDEVVVQEFTTNLIQASREARLLRDLFSVQGALRPSTELGEKQPRTTRT